ncbi:prolyl aminopeptidase [Undibacterium oligocarboniphilum]|uniref:Proline iminopeptidase n=1 Tax=Undibacterium oligocarboniphilum TaxID=666702 RepID=A0A850QGB4_9BURK|nr:prolyl aminopeptidase [Undibacterium oligocarboniphilum]MBC3870036.1 prolyl aminopeptidase [Undibacterium oligocarboniphilum]NVO78027.1 prolyl aminopeptidase [Undibacterium oligocarboniphilum]
MTTEAMITVFPEIEPYRTGTLAVDALHTLYWEECGNPDGQPVLFLHGGPGAGTSPAHRRFFDPAHYRIVLFDQRGAGKSTPLGEYRNNTTPLLIEDIEKIRVMLGIQQWLVFGGSWGSTLALAYGEAHPERCLGFILRGIFLCTKTEVEWFVNGMQYFYPEVHQQFAEGVPEVERGDLLQAYVKRLFCDDPAIYTEAARNWSRYEGSCLFLKPQAAAIASFESDEVSLGIGRLEAHYMQHGAFMDDDALIRNIGKIRHLPAVIVQGRYDVICPPVSAYRLHQAWPEAAYHVIGDAGHAAMEPGIAAALVRATEDFKIQQRFS